MNSMAHTRITNNNNNPNPGLKMNERNHAYLEIPKTGCTFNLARTCARHISHPRYDSIVLKGHFPTMSQRGPEDEIYNMGKVDK